MNKLIEKCREEEKIAYIHGWDFSHIDTRYTEETDFPWNFREEIIKHLNADMKLLDIDTGGGEFLLSLGHPYNNTSATEGYGPNVELCRDTLLPLGIDFRKADAEGILPFEDDFFDMVINRHGSFNPREIYRVLKKDGLFITQQVGAENDRELVELLCGTVPKPFPEQYASVISEKFAKAGFDIIRQEECYKKITFYDVPALVWFARIIQWEFPDFSVENNKPGIIKAQKLLESEGKIEGHTHRILIVAKK